MLLVHVPTTALKSVPLYPSTNGPDGHRPSYAMLQHTKLPLTRTA